MPTATEQQAQQDRRNIFERMMDGMRPTAGGLFGMAIWGAIFAGIAFFVLKHVPQAQELLGRILPDEAKAWINSKLGDSFFPGAAEALIARPANEVSATLREHAGLDTTTADAVGSWMSTNNEALVAEVRAANGGRFSLDTMRSPATMRHLMQNRPDLVRSLITALPVPAAGASGNAAGLPPMLLDPIKDLLKPENRASLNAILANNDSRLAIAEAIVKFAPSLGGSITFKDNAATALSNYIKQAGMNNGNEVTPAFATFLEKVLTDPTQAQAAIQGQLLSTRGTHPEASLALSNAVTLGAAAPAAAPVAGQPAPATPAISSTQLQALYATPAFTTLAQALGPDKLVALQGALLGDRTAALSFMRDNNETIGAPLQAFRNDAQVARMLNTIPAMRTGIDFMLRANDSQLDAAIRLYQNGVNPEAMQTQFMDSGKLSTTKLVDYLLDPTNLNTLRGRQGWSRPLGDLGNVLRLVETQNPDERRALSMLTFTKPAFGVQNAYTNLAAIYACFDVIANAPANQGANAARTQHVMHALVGALTKDKGAIGEVNARELAGFFREPHNRQAFGVLLNGLDTSQMDARSQRLFNVLKARWGTGNGVNGGIAELLTNEAAAQKFIDGLKSYAENAPAAPPPRGLTAWVGERAVDAWIGVNVRADLRDDAHALMDAVAPPPTPAARPRAATPNRPAQ